MPDSRKPSTTSQKDAKPAGGRGAARRSPSQAGKRSGTGTPIGTIGGGQYVGGSHELGFDDAGLHIPTGNSEILLSRRQLLYGAIGVAAVAAAGGVAAAVGSSDDGSSSSDSLAVAQDEVFTLDDCVETPVEDALALIGEYKLPYGSLVWAGNEGMAACLLPTESDKPLVTAAILNLASGYQATVLDQAVGQDEGYEIYDMRATDEGAIWTEANILTGDWRVFASPLSQMTLSDPRKVDEGDASLEMPTLAALGGAAFWQVMSAESDDPDADVGQTTVRSASLAKPGDARTVFTAEGRCSTTLSPATAEGGVVVTPVDPEAKSHRQLLLLDADGQVRDSLTLPARMTPLEACYGTTGFAFSFESIYNYGEGISNLGTYTPREKPSVGDYSHREWFRFARTPSMPPAWCNDWLMVKSTSAVVAVNLKDKRYAILPTDNNTEIYGDCLASAGANDTVVTYQNIDRTAAVQDNEQVTDDDRQCLVHVWTTPDNAGITSLSDDGDEYDYF